MKNYDLAIEILGEDFISPEDVMKEYEKIIYTEEQLIMFKETIPEREILEWCHCNNFMLVPGPHCQRALIEIYNIYDTDYKELKKYYNNHKYVLNKEDMVETKWYMIRKGFVPESTLKNWSEQQVLLSEVEAIPNALEFFWASTIYKVIKGTYSFSSFVRTSSLDSSCHISVGRIGQYGLFVYRCWDSTRDSALGLSSKRK